jgi:quercetin dioxygenase-like cupin family protein
VLAAPGERLPRAPRAQRLFQSDVLEGVPRKSTLLFIEVRLPPGAETSVHTHPGPEFIVGTAGRFDYENAIEGARPFGPGDTAGIPPDTPVQKRNRSGADAVFLSWFLVDADEPFAPGARFERSRGA